MSFLSLLQIQAYGGTAWCCSLVKVLWASLELAKNRRGVSFLFIFEMFKPLSFGMKQSVVLLHLQISLDFFSKIEVLYTNIIENITERIINLFIYPKYIFQ